MATALVSPDTVRHAALFSLCIKHSRWMVYEWKDCCCSSPSYTFQRDCSRLLLFVHWHVECLLLLLEAIGLRSLDMNGPNASGNE